MSLLSKDAFDAELSSVNELVARPTTCRSYKGLNYFLNLDKELAIKCDTFQKFVVYCELERPQDDIVKLLAFEYAFGFLACAMRRDRACLDSDMNREAHKNAVAAFCAWAQKTGKGTDDRYVNCEHHGKRSVASLYFQFNARTEQQKLPPQLDAVEMLKLFEGWKKQPISDLPATLRVVDQLLDSTQAPVMQVVRIPPGSNNQIFAT